MGNRLTIYSMILRQLNINLEKRKSVLCNLIHSKEINFIWVRGKNKAIKVLEEGYRRVFLYTLGRKGVSNEEIKCRTVKNRQIWLYN